MTSSAPLRALELQAFDIVVVPFPFTDRATTKRRPALVLSTTQFNQQAKHAVMAMITSADQFAWPGDCPIHDLNTAGLASVCLIRLKLFTLDERLVIRRAGTLAELDQKKFQAHWKAMMAFT